ncbi:MAG: hypothetical protein IPJ19_09385 [Planctomycetes bacterium]|nr:hypothetical protein [Planctomycetota bacterium]
MSDPSMTPAPRRPFFRGWRKLAALLLGALLILSVCLPWIAGALAPGFVERAFAERFEGRLSVGAVHLSWFGAQSLEDLRLSDPQGAEVARLDVQLPSLGQLARGGGRALGTIAVQLQAALVADDAGISNLERALAPRKARPPPANSESSGSSTATPGAEPEVELVLTSPLCSWSDVRTRASGKPFEVHDLRVRVALHPGQPAQLEARARIAGAQEGELELDAQVDGLRTQAAPGFTKARAKGKVRGFSSAMLDALAQQHGALEQVLGPSFDLSFELGELGPRSGTLSCALQSERTHLVVEGRVQDGLLRLAEQRGFALELGEPRAFVEHYLASFLPPATQLVWSDVVAPWKLECAVLELPLPSAPPANAAELSALLAGLRVDASLSIPGPIGLENELTRGVHLHPALSGLACRIRSGEHTPLVAEADARLIAGETGKLHAELRSSAPWGALARGEIPVLDGRVAAMGISNATLDAVLGREGFLAEGFGRSLDLTLDFAGASLAGGTIDATLHSANIDLGVHARVEDGNLVGVGDHGLELHFAPPTGWIERQTGPFLPQGLALSLSTPVLGIIAQDYSLPLRAADLDACLAQTQAHVNLDLPGCALALPDGRVFELGISLVRVTLGKGGRCALRDEFGLVRPGPAACVLTGDVANLGDLARGSVPPVSFDLSLSRLPTKSLEPWIASGGRAQALLGELVDLKLRGEQLDLRGGALDLLLHAPKLDARLAFAGEKGTWRSSGGEADRIALTLEPADLARELGPYLPPGTQLALDPKSTQLELSLHEFSLVLPADPGQLADPVALLAAVRAKLGVALPGCSFTNALTKEAGITPALVGAHAEAELADGGVLGVVFDAGIGGAGAARVHASCAAARSSP